MPGNEKKNRGRPRSDPKTEFGRWYAESGLTAEMIREELGCGRSYVYELVRGDRVPSLQNAIRLINFSEKLGMKVIDPNDFLPTNERIKK